MPSYCIWESALELRKGNGLSIRLASITAIGPFEYRWPNTVERFERGWDCRVLVDDRPVRVRHGLGRRDVYGRSRVHSVTWVGGWPSVEGVEADDYLRSRALLSLLRRGDKRMVRSDEDLPPGYDGFSIVNHQDELRAPYTRTGFAVKIIEDNLAAWAAHALIRAVTLQRLPWSAKERAGGKLRAAVVPPPDAIAPSDRRKIVDALLSYADRLESVPDKVPSFTPYREANALVVENPFAFLLAVIFDQGIPAERAWEAPYELQRRLGHLDPVQMAKHSRLIESAVAGPPSLHRFVRKLPDWIVSAAKKVTEQYGSDAARIWEGKPSARELQARLQEFEGIGQKKAAMAVEILERDLKVPVQSMEGSDVAYDIHLRRVFLRTGLAERDDLDHMLDTARRLNPERPGRLDFVAWRIGRTWCHAGTPDCDSCLLSDVCPKEIYRAEGVRPA